MTREVAAATGNLQQAVYLTTAVRQGQKIRKHLLTADFIKLASLITLDRKIHRLGLFYLSLGRTADGNAFAIFVVHVNGVDLIDIKNRRNCALECGAVAVL